MTIVVRDGVKFPCKDEAQLKLFLEAGYKLVEQKAPQAEPTKEKKRIIKK